MSSITIGILGILLLFLLMALRMQIGFAMALAGFLGFSVLNSFQAGFGLLGLEPFQTASAYTLNVIPLFLLMGQFANHADLGADLYQAAFRWFGFVYSTPAFLLLTQIVLGYRQPAVMVGYSIGVTAAVYYAFSKILNLALPAGDFFG